MREPVRDKGRLEHILSAIDNIDCFLEGQNFESFSENIGLYSQNNNTTGFSARAAGEGYVSWNNWHLDNVGDEGKYWSSSINNFWNTYYCCFQ